MNGGAFSHLRHNVAPERPVNARWHLRKQETARANPAEAAKRLTRSACHAQRLYPLGFEYLPSSSAAARRERIAPDLRPQCTATKRLATNANEPDSDTHDIR